MPADPAIRLSDGRLLAYREWGDPLGIPVIYCHGLPGSRLECWGGAARYRAAGVRLVTVDRPGIGRSSPMPDRLPIDWALDVDQLTRALGIEKFALAGHSAGGGYALLCAQALPERVSTVAVVGAIPRVDHAHGLEQLETARYWLLARRRPLVMRMAYRLLLGGLRAAPRRTTTIFFRDAAEADRSALAGDAARERFRASTLEGFAAGARGTVDDMRTLMRPWGFAGSRLRAPVHLWHGAADRHVHVSSSRAYAAEMPGAELTVVPGEGHFSLLERRADQILAALARAAHQAS